MSASEKDLQELLRLLTQTRKLPILQAMGQVKALQVANLRSIQQIAEAPLPTVETAIKDAAVAKSLQNSCKTAWKRSGTKRGAAAAAAAVAASSSSLNKRQKRSTASGSNSLLPDPGPTTPAELEASLALPVVLVSADDPDRATAEQQIAATVLRTNRAPLVLAFAVELLRYTMPEQPLSSRLSLAQAVVSANSRSRASHLGMAWARGPSAEDEGFGTATRQSPPGVWSVSQYITLKDSTFVARATTMTDPAQRAGLIRALIDHNPRLRDASHNAWAYRVHSSYHSLSSSSSSPSLVRQDAFDDGETGCGQLMLTVLQELNVIDTLVVLTRWFGGTLLGPDRFRLMRNSVTGALAERLRLAGGEARLSGEAVWGLDLEAMRETDEKEKKGGSGRFSSSTSFSSSISSSNNMTVVVGMPTHRPEAARQYLLKSFATWEEEEKEIPSDNPNSLKSPKKTSKKKHKTYAADMAEKEDNLGLLLGALRLLYDSWADHLAPAELDRRAWSWYVTVRPDVDSGPAGWGAKGALKLRDILDLRRTPKDDD